MNTYRAGIDIGSTTVKIALLDEKNNLIYGNYVRHQANTQGAMAGLLKDVREKLGDCALQARITGSGAITLAKAMGIGFVQEVVAVAGAPSILRRMWQSNWAVKMLRSSISPAAWRSA